MAIIKCKMCGGDLQLSGDQTFGICQFCGSTMTLPKVDDEQRAAAFNRGNHFRRIGEFDKALAVYEHIVSEDDRDAEAHWCCALCRFGIEYVEDPTTYEWLPTCHRSSFDSFLEDVDYKAALEYSEGVTRRQYQKDAAKIAEVQRSILATSQNAEPYDVFICYKESDENGNRTRDSLMAQDIYYQLTEQGRKVFFARITLEDVAGTQYEPYIFAALNSARVMIVVGTKPEYLNAVWVRNEWSRFLAMMKKDRQKLLLPCYRDMDPYDLPEQLSILQSYDMSKIGFIQDLTRGIAKVLDADKKPEPVKEVIVTQQAAPAANTAPLLKRAFMFLEDGDWTSADEYCEKVLDIDPESPMAYVGKLMAELKVRKQEALKDCLQPFDGNHNYQKALRFGDEKLKARLTEDNENARMEGIYVRGKKMMSENCDEDTFKEIANLFETIREYKDAVALVQQCFEKAEAARKDTILLAGKAKINGKNCKFIANYEAAIQLLQSIPGWKDADEIVSNCRKRIEELAAKEEANRLEREHLEEMARNHAKRQKTIKRIVVVTLLTVTAAVILWLTVISPFVRYSKAVSLMETGDKAGAAVVFGELGDYKDSKAQHAALWKEVAPLNAVRETISAGNAHTVGLKKDGTVVAVGSTYGGKCNVSGWTNIVAVSVGDDHTVGLKRDGTVVAVGRTYSGRSNVSDWTSIVAVSAGNPHTVGLKVDGTVVAVGDNDDNQCDVSDWTDIVAVSAGGDHTVGLKKDGTVVAVGDNDDNQCDVSDWTDIVAVSAGNTHTVGLKRDGTVVAAGDNNDDRCNVSGWTDIVAVSAGGYHTVGLKRDGTVVAVGYNRYGQCDVSDWTDIVAVSAGGYHTVGLKKNGTVVAVGSTYGGKCNVSGWTNIKLPD